jgi:hypothetical protein
MALDSATPKPIFRTPEDVTPELGMTRTELHRYCRISGFHTRLSNRRIMLHEDDIRRLVEWVCANPKQPSEWLTDPERDPFA